ncbi:acyltransferase family protein [Mucilaginibacter lappiensis]|uniref:acyltransferase family protein n=1 Tax=Mucilaginibacter lappiensis TaxID=354630 RepID=UPI003D21E6F7
MRFENIDLLKGLLIILVISGHVLQGSLSENFARYIIYSFHMPVFIGISGFLFNSAKIGSVSFKELISKYLFRVIIPWAIAIIAYMVIVNSEQLKHGHKLGMFVMSFVSPYYHLWFIPAFLSWVFITWLSEKLKIGIKGLLVFSGVVSLGFLILSYYPAFYKSPPALNKALDLLLGTFKPQFYVFFVFGIYLRNHPVKNKLMHFVVLASFIGVVILFFYPNKIFGIILFFLFNLSFLNLLTAKARENFFPHVKSIQWLGVNSLAIYLWHVVPIILVTKLVGTNNLLLFYGVTVTAEVIFILIIAQISKIKSINKYVFGMG